MPGTGAAITAGSDQLFGETCTAGQPLYRGSDLKLYKAISDTAAHAACVGIALNGGAAGQPAAFQSGGIIAIGGTAAQGTPYWVSGSAGGIQPYADVGSGEYCTLVGVGDGSGNIVMSIKAYGLTHA